MGKIVNYCVDCGHNWYADPKKAKACPQCGRELNKVPTKEAPPSGDSASLAHPLRGRRSS